MTPPSRIDITGNSGNKEYLFYPGIFVLHDEWVSDFRNKLHLHEPHEMLVYRLIKTKFIPEKQAVVLQPATLESIKEA